MRLHEHGLLGGLFKLVFYGLILFVVLAVLYPGMITEQDVIDTPDAIEDGLESMHRAFETGTAADVEEIDIEVFEQQIHDDVNDMREQHVLDPLTFDQELADIARDYSQDMAEREFFDHYSPEGEDFTDRYAAAGYDCEVRDGDQIYTGGENLALNSIGRPVQDGERREFHTDIEDVSQAIVRGWMESPEHRENILQPAWENQGIGVHVTDEGAVYVTQKFC